ncbi:MAG TPA: hypothetical protein VFI26_02670, partial [Lysobacter sp.]|nr:hypothetical protein [Lysobacter sp.]
QDGVMYDLNDPDLIGSGHSDVITDAQDINDLGQITGQTCTPDGSVCYAFRADPIPDHAPGSH